MKSPSFGTLSKLIMSFKKKLRQPLGQTRCSKSVPECTRILPVTMKNIATTAVQQCSKIQHIMKFKVFQSHVTTNAFAVLVCMLETHVRVMYPQPP